HRRYRSGDVPEQVEAFTASGMPVTYRDVESARVILVVGLDAEQELPILHLRIRKAARSRALVFVIHSRRTRLFDVAEHVLVAPGGEAAVLDALASSGATAESATPPPVIDRIRAMLEEVGDEALVLVGPRAAESAGAVAAAAN